MYDSKAPNAQNKNHKIRSFENSKEIIEIYYLIARNKRQIKEECKKYFIKQGCNMVIRTENLVDVLDEMFPMKLNQNKWKIIVSIGDKHRNHYIDVDYFFYQINLSNRLNISQPKI